MCVYKWRKQCIRNLDRDLKISLLIWSSENLGSTNYYLKEESTAALYLACFRWQLCRTRERTALKCPGLPWCTWLRRRRGRNTCHRYRPMLLPRVDLITDHLPKLSKILPCLALFFYSFSLKNWRERGKIGEKLVLAAKASPFRQFTFPSPPRIIQIQWARGNLPFLA